MWLLRLSETGIWPAICSSILPWSTLKHLIRIQQCISCQHLRELCLSNLNDFQKSSLNRLKTRLHEIVLDSECLSTRRSYIACRAAWLKVLASTWTRSWVELWTASTLFRFQLTWKVELGHTLKMFLKKMSRWVAPRVWITSSSLWNRVLLRLRSPKLSIYSLIYFPNSKLSIIAYLQDICKQMSTRPSSLAHTGPWQYLTCFRHRFWNKPTE